MLYESKQRGFNGVDTHIWEDHMQVKASWTPFVIYFLLFLSWFIVYLCQVKQNLVLDVSEWRAVITCKGPTLIFRIFYIKLHVTKITPLFHNYVQTVTTALFYNRATGLYVIKTNWYVGCL
jgi:hypothetical protein